jgi:hypothetical protein
MTQAEPTTVIAGLDPRLSGSDVPLAMRHPLRKQRIDRSCHVPSDQSCARGWRSSGLRFAPPEDDARGSGMALAPLMANAHYNGPAMTPEWFHDA